MSVETNENFNEILKESVAEQNENKQTVSVQNSVEGTATKTDKEQNFNNVNLCSELDKNADKSSENDMQATQRIEIIGELFNSTEKSKDNSVLNSEKIENKNENQKFIDNTEVSSVEITNNESVNHNSTNAQGISTSVTNMVQNVENKYGQNVINSNKSSNNNLNNCMNNNIIIDEKRNIKSNQKEHTQDKKDYRLERLLFERINVMQGKIKESLELIKKFERINAKEENLPNIVTTLHDKLTQEVIKQFRTVGIEFNMKSYLVQAIVSDLLCKFEEGITEFKECSENLNFVREVQDDFESRVALEPTNRVKNIFAKLRGLFRPERKQEIIERLERQRQEKKLEEANIHLIKYKFKNSELEKYTIRKNILDSLTREMLHGKSSGLNYTVSEFIEERITPEMKKLGLQYLNDGLKEQLYKGFKEKCRGVGEEEFFQMRVGDVKKSVKDNSYDVVKSKISMIAGGKSQDEEERMVI